MLRGIRDLKLVLHLLCWLQLFILEKMIGLVDLLAIGRLKILNSLDWYLVVLLKLKLLVWHREVLGEIIALKLVWILESRISSYWLLKHRLVRSADWTCRLAVGNSLMVSRLLLCLHSLRG